MIFTPTRLDGAWIVEVEKRRDERGFFARTWCRQELAARGLDTEIAQEIIGLLYEISRTGRAVVIATHDFHLFEHFTGRTIRCEGGRITEK